MFEQAQSDSPKGYDRDGGRSYSGSRGQPKEKRSLSPDRRSKAMDSSSRREYSPQESLRLVCYCFLCFCKILWVCLSGHPSVSY